MAEDKPFISPKVAINRVYTRGGDDGETSLVGGERVGKESLRIAAYGTVDELNAFVGAARVTAQDASIAEVAQIAETLLRVQHELFNLGAILATPPESARERLPRVREREVARLEQEIDVANAGLPELRSFVLPGGCALSTQLHQCRTICRRAERLVVTLGRGEPVEPVLVAYLNRLSDAFFVWSRSVDRAFGVRETLWDPNLGVLAEASE